MTDDILIEEAATLSRATIRFLCRQIKKVPYNNSAERDAIILYALMRIVISKIIHRSATQSDANVVFQDFVTSLIKTWEDHEFVKERETLN